MELRARLGTGERGEESGSERQETLLCEVLMLGRGNFAICAQAGTGDKALVLWFGRSCGEKCGHTFESDWMALESGRVGQFASEGELLRGKVGPDAHVGSAVRAAPGG